MNSRPLWIRQPLAILADGAEEGVVVHDGIITELVGAGQTPHGFKTGIEYDTYDASDLVVIPGLETLSSDKVVQEIMLDRLRSHRLAVVSTEESEHELIATPSTDPARMLIRDVLFRVDQYSDLLEPTEAHPALRIAPLVEESDTSPIDADVLIEFVEEAPTASAS